MTLTERKKILKKLDWSSFDNFIISQYNLSNEDHSALTSIICEIHVLDALLTIAMEHSTKDKNTVKKIKKVLETIE